MSTDDNYRPNDEAEAESEAEEPRPDGPEYPALLQYLETDQGHEIANKIITFSKILARPWRPS
ncbi:MAG: hypothetical protein ACREDR_11140 [Blastocatellia bacterium]